MCWPPTGEWKQEAIHLNGAGKTQGGKHVESNQYMKVIQTHRGLQMETSKWKCKQGDQKTISEKVDTKGLKNCYPS